MILRARIIKEPAAACMTLSSHITPAPTNTHIIKELKLLAIELGFN
jgi:hypothetical protein